MDLDFSAFNDRLDFNIYDKSIIDGQEEEEQVQEASPKIILGPIDDPDNFIEKEKSYIDIEKSATKEEKIKMLDLEKVVLPSEVEYAPPKETGLLV